MAASNASLSWAYSTFAKRVMTLLLKISKPGLVRVSLVQSEARTKLFVARNSVRSALRTQPYQQLPAANVQVASR